MSHPRPTRDRFDDLFSDGSNESSVPSPYTKHEHPEINSEDAAWEMRDEAVPESGKDSEPRPDVPSNLSRYPASYPLIEEGSVEVDDQSRSLTEDTFQDDRAPYFQDDQRLESSDDTYGSLEDPILWESSDDNSASGGEEGIYTSYRTVPRNEHHPSPTEAELIAERFEFHKDIPENTRNRLFREEYLRQACEDTDAKLPRKIQWRAWKAARDRHKFLQNYADDKGRTHEEGLQEELPHMSSKTYHAAGDVGVSITGSNPIFVNPTTTQIPGLEYAHASIVHSKPYLSDLSPAETRSHHPTTIPRSPQRQPSRASSLSSLTTIDMFGRESRYRPQTNVGTLDEEGDAKDFEIYKDALSSAKTELLDYTSLGKPDSSAPATSPSDLGTEVCEPYTPARVNVELVGMESTRAVRGSPVRFPPDAIFRPDTPRPSVSDSSMYESIERDPPVDSWTTYRSPSQPPRSTSPSPSSLQSGDQDHEMSDPSAPVEMCSDNTNTLEGPNTVQECVDVTLSPMLTSQSITKAQIVDDPLEVKRREAWLDFGEVLQKAKNHVTVKTKSSASPSRITDPEGHSSTRTDETLTAVDNQSHICDDHTPTGLSNDVLQNHPLVSSRTVTSQAPDGGEDDRKERSIPQPRLLKAWQEPTKPVSNVSNVDRSGSGAFLPDAGPLELDDVDSPIRGYDSESLESQIQPTSAREHECPTLDLLPGVVEAVYEAKKDQRKVTGARNTTRGLAPAVKKSRAEGTKERRSPSKRAVTGKVGTAAGVQGDKAKVQKSRPGARTVSRKAMISSKVAYLENDVIPAIPPLPEPEQMDIDDALDQDPTLPGLSQGKSHLLKVKPPSIDPVLKVDKTRKNSSPIKAKPTATEKMEVPKTPNRPTTNSKQTKLTPQSAGEIATPRRRSPRLLEREEKAREAAAALRNQSSATEMDIDPATPTEKQEEAGSKAEFIKEQTVQKSTGLKRKQPATDTTKTSRDEK